MERLKGLVKTLVKRIILRSFKEALKQILIILGPYILVVAAVLLVLVTIFGAAYSDDTIKYYAPKVKERVEKLQPPCKSFNCAERKFILPWGIPYAVELYATNWDENIDLDRIALITAKLNPIFKYQTVKIIQKTTITRIVKKKDANGEEKEEKITETETSIGQVLAVVQANTFEGIYNLRYRNTTKVTHEKGDNYEKTVETTYPELVDMEYCRDFSRLDAVITQEIVGGAINVEEYNFTGGKLAWPVPSSHTVTSTFGIRVHPKTGEVKMHTGIDIAANYGADIIAAADGVVKIAGSYGGYGNAVVIDHGGGMSTLYGHNSKLLVHVGETVERGQKIAEAGSTGVSTGAHCHFEVRNNGVPQDPVPYLSGNAVLTGGAAYAISDIDRQMVLETAYSFMDDIEHMGWLIGEGTSGVKYNVKPGEIPDELLPVFRQAGERYEIPWNVLAAIAFRESGFTPDAIGPYLPDLDTRAVGMMQFLKSTFDAYAVDGNHDGIKSPFQPEDAIWTAAKYLNANYTNYKRQGMDDEEALRHALWNYNHAWWYVDQVMSIAEQYQQKYGEK